MTFNGWLTICMFAGVALAVIGATTPMLIGNYASATILDGGVLLAVIAFTIWAFIGLGDHYSEKEQS